MNDLATPFYVVFLSGQLEQLGVDVNLYEATSATLGDDLYDSISIDILTVVEADCFWCLSRLLDGIQDNYTSMQPGIHRQIKHLKELIGRID